MKIVFYCQHVLGVGHFHRSLEVCLAIAKEHQVTMVLGGPDISIEEPSLTIFKLPGLKMDHDFKNLQPCDPKHNLEETKKMRADMLLDFFKQHNPDVFITELYPFGRKAFRFELDPVLQAIKDKVIPNCLAFCSLRDILVERKDDQVKFETRVIKTLHKFFHGLLIHSDKNRIPLEDTFKQADKIHLPQSYTGFVCRKAKTLATKELFVPVREKKLIVVSIGGGSVGGELLLAVANAFFENPHKTKDYHLQIFTGLYSEKSLTKELESLKTDNISISNFTPNFPEWLSRADLSISMAGYNSCMDTIIANIPALLYPFEQNHEQRFRVECLQHAAPLYLLSKEDLQPDKILAKIHMAISSPKNSGQLDIDGAQQTLQQVNLWHAQLSQHEK